MVDDSDNKETFDFSVPPPSYFKPDLVLEGWLAPLLRRETNADWENIITEREEKVRKYIILSSVKSWCGRP